jgi:hypothetical protein
LIPCLYPLKQQRVPACLLIIKTLQGRPTNWPVPEGALTHRTNQFSRNNGRFRPRVFPPKIHSHPSSGRPNQGTKNPSAGPFSGDSASESAFQKRGEFCRAPLRLSTNFFAQSLRTPGVSGGSEERAAKVADP